MLLVHPLQGINVLQPLTECLSYHLFIFYPRSKDASVDEFFNNDLDSDDEEPESDNEDFAGIDTIVEEDDGSDMELPKPKKQTAAEKQKQAAKEEAAKKIQLDALKEKDPEFYKYLQENDQDLLAFDGEMEDLVSEEEEEEDEDEDEEDEEMEGSDEEMEDVTPKVTDRDNNKPLPLSLR